MSARHVEDLRYNGPLTHRLRSTAAHRWINRTLKLSQCVAGQFQAILRFLLLILVLVQLFVVGLAWLGCFDHFFG